MENFNTLWSRALAIATRAHEGQVDKAGGCLFVAPDTSFAKVPKGGRKNSGAFARCCGR